MSEPQRYSMVEGGVFYPEDSSSMEPDPDDECIRYEDYDSMREESAGAISENRKEWEQPRGTVLLPSKEYRAEQDELRRLRAQVGNDAKEIAELLERASHATLEWQQTHYYKRLRYYAAEADAARQRIAELQAVTGQKMPCGCYAVEFDSDAGGLLYCGRHSSNGALASPTSEYAAWRESRGSR